MPLGPAKITQNASTVKLFFRHAFTIKRNVSIYIKVSLLPMALTHEDVLGGLGSGFYVLSQDPIAWNVFGGKRVSRQDRNHHADGFTLVSGQE